MTEEFCQMFHPSSGQDKRSWRLPDSMVDSVLNNFNRYFKDSILKGSILDEHPVPKNVAEVYPKILD